MDFFGVLTMAGGLALFMYGMNIMGDGLAKTAGGKLEQILEKLTANTFMAVLLGCCVTAVIQSSSATTVMVVGFVNSGIMKLQQAVGVIMGANIGTTVTSWLLSLTGIQGESFFMRLLKPTSFSPALALVGVCLIMFAKSGRKKDIGTILVGFAVLMTGMETMSAAVEPLADVPEFTGILMRFRNPVLGMIAGLILTAVIQSSSASVGILQALCVTGAVNFSNAIPIIMGQNIGTCVTALLSAVGASKNAKRAALVHLYFNVIGTALFMALFYSLNAAIHFSFMNAPVDKAGIALVHTVFNILATCALLPFKDALVKLACMTIRDTDKDEEASQDGFKLLDERFLEKPAFAVAQAKKAAVLMAQASREDLFLAMRLVEKYDKHSIREILALEDQVDRYEDELGTYLMKISSRELNHKDSMAVTMMLHCIGDFERISDHAVNIMHIAKKMNDKKESFSEKAKEELRVYGSAVQDIVTMAYRVFDTEDVSEATKVEPLEEVIDALNDEIKKKHVKRLRKGKCTIASGFSLSDLIADYERIADHCSNIAVCLIQVKEDGFETHEYLGQMKQGENAEYKKRYKHYREVYKLP